MPFIRSPVGLADVSGRIGNIKKVILFAFVAGLAIQAQAGSQTPAQPDADFSEHRLLSLSGASESTSASEIAISPAAREVAELTGILALYQRLLAEQQKTLESRPAADSLQDLRRNQRIIYLRGQIMQNMQSLQCDLRRAIGRIDAESADVSDLKAFLADQRAKVQHRTSMANLVSGGATRIGAYSAGLNTVNPMPVCIPEIFDGVIQIALSTLMVRQEKKEERSSSLTPEILVSFLTMRETAPKFCPQRIWDYLNRSAPGRKDGKSPRQVVIDAWLGQGRVSDASSESHSKKVGATVSTVSGLRLTHTSENSLDVTLAMMADIKATLSGLESGMSDLSETLRKSYANDPEI